MFRCSFRSKATALSFCTVLLLTVQFVYFLSKFTLWHKIRVCLFRLFAASGHQKLMRTAKHSPFRPVSIKFVWIKTIQNQHKHIIS
jgi:hypothetical protein